MKKTQSAVEAINDIEKPLFFVIFVYAKNKNSNNSNVDSRM